MDISHHPLKVELPSHNFEKLLFGTKSLDTRFSHIHKIEKK